MSRTALEHGQSPRRILMTVDAGEEAWEHALELCKGLTEAGVQVVLAVSGSGPDQRQLTAALSLDGVEVALAPRRREGIPLPQAHDWLLDLEEARRCEVVHLGGYQHAELPFRGPKVLTASTCGRAWWRAVKGAEPPRWGSHQRQVAAALAAADCVVTPSAWLLQTLDEQYGPLPSSTVIAPGRSPGVFTAGEKDPFVLGVGALGDEVRDTALLARVAARLPWPVKIVETAGERRPAPEPAPPDPAGPMLLGRVSTARLVALYGQAAIFACPSRYETFGLGVHEAALSECALVLSDLPNLRELWGGAAIFVPPGDEEALHSTLVTLMNQPELAALLALRAHQRAVLHSSTRMVKRYLAVYRKLLALRPAAHPTLSAASSHVS